MSEFQFSDSATLSGTRKLEDGYLVTEAFAVRTGIQLYSGAEVGLADKDVVRVYRPEDEVRAPESLATFSHAPVTMGHPKRVTADNWADLAKGEVSTEAKWEGGKIKLPLIIKDAAAIAAVEAGTRELSAGYVCQLEFKDGTTPEGEAYDAIQRNIRVNHLAIVPKGRAGSECRIGDGADTWGAAPITLDSEEENSMSNQTMTVVLGDKAVTVAAADAPAIEAFKAASAKELQDTKDAHQAVLDAKDAELAKKDAEIDDLKGKQLSDADLDKRVAARAKLVGDAVKVDQSVKTEGLSDAAIRKAVVAAKLGDAAIEGKSDAYIEARFDVLAEDAAKGDPFADTLKSGIESGAGASLADKAYQESLTEMSDAWKGGAEQKGA
ncbi:DUF2213 domain-containing protein [Leisingera sp. ANG-Vp]|uniref:DUF2213 domain-containing protein n=1 Tax=Leisingera sp. ANG-Vp TaxID=1577896 RepID=UPI00057F227F|nr:DUF2213 domain-containing protein [Leisingera sp. ANG-Vp]KIC22500.1 hypothetical protein RA20_01070 [Leisingera sp. ANG-Vp]